MDLHFWNRNFEEEKKVEMNLSYSESHTIFNIFNMLHSLHFTV